MPWNEVTHKVKCWWYEYYEMPSELSLKKDRNASIFGTHRTDVVGYLGFHETDRDHSRTILKYEKGKLFMAILVITFLKSKINVNQHSKMRNISQIDYLNSI